MEQILEVSRITADTLAIQRELVPIPEYFEKLRQECDPIARARGGTFVIRPLDYKIDTDPALLSRVIRNLVNNAFKYSDKEHPIVILAARRRAKGLIQICIYDNGPGISREDREKIFHSFYRGEAGQEGGRVWSGARYCEGDLQPAGNRSLHGVASWEGIGFQTAARSLNDYRAARAFASRSGEEND